MNYLNFTFQAQTVAVQTDISALASFLARRLSRMLSSPGPNVRHSIAVIGHPGDYSINGESFSGPLSSLLHRIEFQILNALIEANPQFLWMHAGAVVRDGAALLVAGQAGSGKSTSVLGLCQRQWHFVSDDMLPVQLETLTIHPFPRTPWQRIPEGVELPPNQIRRLKKREVMLEERLIQTEPVRIGAIVLPVYRHGGSLAVERLAGSAIVMALVEHTFNFAVHGPAALALLARVATSVPTYRIQYSDSQPLLDAIERHWNAGVGVSAPPQAEVGLNAP